MIERVDLVFRVDAEALDRGAAKHKSRAILLAAIAGPLLFVGAGLVLYSFVAIAMHAFDGTREDVVAAVLVVVVTALPLLAGAALAVASGRRFTKGAALGRLLELARGRTHVTLLDLASLAARPTDAILRDLHIAAEEGAAAQL